MAFDFLNHYASIIGERLRIDAPGKINLRLKIEGLREDGYHKLSMLNVTTDLSDRVFATFKPGSTIECLTLTNFMGESILPSKRDGIAKRLSDPSINSAAVAAKSFISTFKLPVGVEIDLHKDIPVGAGLGGGSSDAGRFLEWMRVTFKDFLQAEHGLDDAASKAEVARLALALGSDVPYFMTAQFCWVRGVGEVVQRLSPRAIPNYSAMLVIVDEEISSADVYKISRAKIESSGKKDALPTDMAAANFVGRYSDFVHSLEADMESSFKVIETFNAFRDEIKTLMGNDLEESIVQHSPRVKEILERLRAVPNVLAFPTGSGSAVILFSQSRHIIDVPMSQAIGKSLQGLPVQLRPTILNPQG